MDSNVNDSLSESVFFTARPRPLPSTTEVSTASASSSTHPASSSSPYYSARIHSLTERMINLNLSEVDTAIEASKDHWTQVEPIYHSTATNSLSAVDASISERQSGTQGASSSEMDPRELYEENLEFLRRLQSEDPVGEFFEDSTGGEYVLGKKIAAGGQADIYESHEFEYGGEKFTLPVPVVMKVFKAGISLVDLREQWPLALLYILHPMHPHYREKAPAFCNSIYNGYLLGDGRFAFVMLRMWGDLRQLMDLRMRHNGNLRPPFMMADGNYLECCILDIMLNIAWGMSELHGEGTLHRDLKASNILIDCRGNKCSDYDPVTNLNHDLQCFVADFECSIGVVGTGYWRAPEILEAVKNRTWSTTPNLFTTKSDVYSYGMICYEILTGHVPFEDIEDLGKTSLDDVLEGKRPSLPRYLKPWVKEWLGRCWHMDPLERPSFEETVDFLEELRSYPNCQRESKFYTFHDYGSSSSKDEED